MCPMILYSSIVVIIYNNISLFIIEYINDDWLVKHVWDSEQLMKNKNEIQRSLIHHIVDDRLQDETLVTDLIDSIISFTPYQQVSKLVINNHLFIHLSIIHISNKHHRTGLSPTWQSNTN